MTKLKIDVTGEDNDACRRILIELCKMVDCSLAAKPGYSVSMTCGSATCEISHQLADDVDDHAGKHGQKDAEQEPVRNA